MSPRVRRFYARVLGAAERDDFEDALELRDAAEEIAMLRLELRRVVEEAPGDLDAIEALTALILRALEMQRRLKPGEAATLTENIHAVYEGILEAVSGAAEEPVR
jgi:hypothetical protein